jgi:predicted nucleotide-binding protein (sugar kinase/HSP70/actin superfamily)
MGHYELKPENIKLNKIDTAIIGNVDDFDVEAELKKFEEEEKQRLGLKTEKKEHWKNDMFYEFTAKQKVHTKIIFYGLTKVQDDLNRAAFEGLGYQVEPTPYHDNEALKFGKEFGNRGQCNPTYYNVGNIIKHLTYLRDVKKIAVADIIENYLLVTVGACGPCRFGTYVTEYRKALEDSGFKGFRVLLINQVVGFQKSAGEEAGLDMTPRFIRNIVWAAIMGDVLNLLGYRTRPYEVNEGETDKIMQACKDDLAEALRHDKGIFKAMSRCKQRFSTIPVDRSGVKPKVSIIGEFWAMTTEGDGNYHLQRFLESEGAEVDIQPGTAWLFYTLWEKEFDTRARMKLKGTDSAGQGLEGVGVGKLNAGLWASKKILTGSFNLCAKFMGLKDYKFADMDEIAEISKEYYSNELRGGEGHMEVGKLIMNTKYKKSTMTVSVKPFGCMPSSGVSDGVQTLITEKYPETIFLPIETNGDGAVNVYSRIQMQLFKARQKAQQEFDHALEKTGLSQDVFVKKMKQTKKFASSLHKSPHHYTNTAADMVMEVGT